LKKARLFIGLPGSGKSTFISNHIRGYHIVDADHIKTTHPNWNPKCPHIVHDWSVEEAELEMNRISDSGIDICMDSGGVNNNYSIRIINMLKSKGYWVEVIHMDTPLDVCLKRNSERDRKVGEDVIIEKSKKIDSCVEKQKALVDSYRRIIYK
jgi:predicted kinase